MGNKQSGPPKSKKEILKKKIEVAGKTGVLTLSESGLTEIPESVYTVDSVRTLDLSSNKLKELPPQLAKFDSLKVLKCGNNVLSRGNIDPIRRMTKLAILSLPNNCIGTYHAVRQKGKESSKKKQQQQPNLPLPPILPTPLPISLKEIDLSNNSLKIFPECIFDLVNLEKLNLSKNSINTIPEPKGFRKLKKLKELDLNYNSLSYLPEEIGACKKLVVVSLAHNEINSNTNSNEQHQPLPKELFTETSLTDLNLSGNKNLNNSILESFDGFDVFVKRRTSLKSKTLAGGAMGDLGLCGLE